LRYCAPKLIEYVCNGAVQFARKRDHQAGIHTAGERCTDRIDSRFRQTPAHSIFEQRTQLYGLAVFVHGRCVIRLRCKRPQPRALSARSIPAQHLARQKLTHAA
jgi:hypothetical protein